MGAGVFHGRVRDGNGCGNPAMATRPPHQMGVCGRDLVCGDWGGVREHIGGWFTARLGAVRGGDVSHLALMMDRVRSGY